MKKRIIFFLFLIGLTMGEIYGQSNNWKASLVYNKDIYKKSDINLSQYTGYQHTKAKFNYTLGIQLEKGFGRFGIATGLQYANKDFVGTYYCHVCDFFAPVLPETIKIRYLEVPVLAKYYVQLTGKFSVVPQAGLTNHFSQEKPEASYEKFETKSFQSALLGTDLLFQINEQMSLGLNLNYQSQLGSSIEKSDFKYKKTSVGLNFTTIIR
ncbi:outer membrane beta-barrel protein [Fulvivirgaceae bacterium BMA10]|uniref:Outer membrane beta-barrel protein n=1 Tax=Splendidivirga corallicola TaxID=3051826 RepID=A0ABT8KZS3_9BACT|nr:outer membrane beta-barrel protein [Fulvivirgaceae bacterium BMA10]